MMIGREEIIKILDRAHDIDSKCELFGASKHQYRLNPPLSQDFVRAVEEIYGFRLPEDYFHFITQIGDGGAGPDYGIYPFEYYLKKGSSPGMEKFYEAYWHSLAKPFTPRQMMADEVEEYDIAAREVYEQAPDKYFIYEKNDDHDLCNTDGFFVLGTHGCQWDFGLILSGEKRGQVFDTDNEGAYGFVSHSFEAFYQDWLDGISDIENLKIKVEERKRLFQKRNGAPSFS